MEKSAKEATALAEEVRDIIDTGMHEAYSSVNQIAVMTYWRVGRRIVEEEQSGKRRAAYGKHLIEDLSKALMPFYGNQYTARRLRDFRLFYLQIPDFEIWHSRMPNLTWTHIRQILPVENEDALIPFSTAASNSSRPIVNARVPNLNWR